MGDVRMIMREKFLLAVDRPKNNTGLTGPLQNFQREACSDAA